MLFRATEEELLDNLTTFLRIACLHCARTRAGWPRLRHTIERWVQEGFVLRKQFISTIFAVAVSSSLALAQQSATHLPIGNAATRRQLQVALYPFIPEYEAAVEHIKQQFEAQNPDVELVILDLRSNYYGSGDANYIGSTDADVYELDSVFLQDFVDSKKIRELPIEALLPPEELLKNADAGTRVGGRRYGAAHWVCRDFLFYSVANKPKSDIRTLADLEAFLRPDGLLLVDLKGKSTLGELYLVSAFDRYSDWSLVAPKIDTFDPSIAIDESRVLKLCNAASCRDQIFHELTGIHGAEFARNRGKALIGYSESLHDVLTETQNNCPDTCLSDKDIDVSDLPLDDAGSTPVSWVDSFTMSSNCKGQCVVDAVRFISMMNSDEMYMKLLLPMPLSFIKVPQPADTVPAYLLPAKASLYSNPALLRVAHLYPKMKTLVENATVPTSDKLNEKLRAIGGTIDKNLGASP
jgi:thiamine pyridinylase